MADWGASPPAPSSSGGVSLASLCGLIRHLDMGAPLGVNLTLGCLGMGAPATQNYLQYAETLRICYFLGCKQRVDTEQAVPTNWYASYWI